MMMIDDDDNLWLDFVRTPTAVPTFPIKREKSPEVSILEPHLQQIWQMLTIIIIESEKKTFVCRE